MTAIAHGADRRASGAGPLGSQRQSGSRTRRYRVVAAWHAGRPLRAQEVVHHVNGDRLDNHPDNLAIVSSQRGHMLLHHYLWREAAGVRHLFSLEETLAANGEYVIWPR